MSMKTTYLEKYSIAPSPSRDYYGLRVLEDEVKLFHWRISHGPHKTPLTQVSNYIDWKNDKLLQTEIKRIFGESWLQYTNDIILNNRSLLTLPKNLIQKLLSFLPKSDIFKLFSLCRAAYDILNTDPVWELLCRRTKKIGWTTTDEKYGMAYGWKQLYKETKDIEMHLGLNKTPKFKMSNLEPKSQQKISPHHKLQLESIPKFSAGKKNMKANSKTKIETLTGDNNVRAVNINGEGKWVSNCSIGGVDEEENFVNIVNLQADDLDPTSNTKRVITSFEEKVSKKNSLGKQIISKFPSDSKFNSPKMKTNNHGKLRVSRTTSATKYHPTVDNFSFKSDDIPLDDLVKHTIEELDKPNGIFDCTYNWLNDMSSPEKQSIAQESPKKCNTSFLTNKYKAARKSVFDSSNFSSISKSSLNPSQMNKKINELSTWQAAKLRALKASEALQPSPSIEEIIKSHPPKLIPRIRKHT